MSSHIGTFVCAVLLKLSDGPRKVSHHQPAMRSYSRDLSAAAGSRNMRDLRQSICKDEQFRISPEGVSTGAAPLGSGRFVVAERHLVAERK